MSQRGVGLTAQSLQQLLQLVFVSKAGADNRQRQTVPDESVARFDPSLVGVNDR